MQHSTVARTGGSSKGRSPRTLYSQKLPSIHPRAAGIDLGAREHWVAVSPKDKQARVRSFGCYTPDLHEMAQWLKTCGVETIAMESTGVYWVPVFEILEAYGFDVNLVDAHHVRNVSGRKSDVSDCQWLQQLHSVGLLAAAFRPEDDICTLRTYTRQRGRFVRACADQIRLMHKALEQMNLQLHKAISDVSGVTGFKIMRAIVAGEHDPEVLVQHRHPQMKSSRATIIKALTGNYREEHLFTLQQALELYDLFQQKIQECDTRIEAHLATFTPRATEDTIPPRRNKTKGRRRKNEPYFDLRSQLYQVAGVDLTQIDGIDALTAQTLLSECGHTMDAFPTEKHFASWLGLCPNNRKTGGRIRSRHSRSVQNRAATALRLAAYSIHRSHSAIGAYYRRLRSRIGAPKAITATAHKLACLVYRMIKYGQHYVDIGEKAYEERFRKQRMRALLNNARRMGYILVAEQTGEIVS